MKYTSYIILLKITFSSCIILLNVKYSTYIILLNKASYLGNQIFNKATSTDVAEALRAAKKFTTSHFVFFTINLQQ